VSLLHTARACCWRCLLGLGLGLVMLRLVEFLLFDQGCGERGDCWR